MAKVVGLGISEKKGAQRTFVNEAEFIEGFGIKGDAHGGKSLRMVSLMGQESINKINQLGIKGLCMVKFAENITTEGIALYDIAVGKHFYVGDVELEVTQIGKECHQNCVVYKKTDECIMSREGIFAKVIKGGNVKIGDSITVV